MGRSLKTALFREKGKYANRPMGSYRPMGNRRTLQTSVVAAVSAVSRGGVVAAVIVVAIVGPSAVPLGQPSAEPLPELAWRHLPAAWPASRR